MKIVQFETSWLQCVKHIIQICGFGQTYFKQVIALVENGIIPDHVITIQRRVLVLFIRLTNVLRLVFTETKVADFSILVQTRERKTLPNVEREDEKVRQKSSPSFTKKLRNSLNFGSDKRPEVSELPKSDAKSQRESEYHHEEVLIGTLYQDCFKLTDVYAEYYKLCLYGYQRCLERNLITCYKPEVKIKSNFQALLNLAVLLLRIRSQSRKNPQIREIASIAVLTCQVLDCRREWLWYGRFCQKNFLRIHFQFSAESRLLNWPIWINTFSGNILL